MINLGKHSQTDYVEDITDEMEDLELLYFIGSNGNSLTRYFTKFTKSSRYS